MHHYISWQNNISQHSSDYLEIMADHEASTQCCDRASPGASIDLEPTQCCDCDSPSASIDLECSKHQVCMGCFVKRGSNQPKGPLKCGECVKSKNKPHTSYRDALLQKEPEKEEIKETTVSLKEEQGSSGIWIFVDDSNIWIEAKKLQSEKRRLKTKQDHRVRIDVGKLADAVADGRDIRKGLLYGSEPPPVDTVWEKIRKIKNFSVHSKHRSQLTGKEKQVDTMLVADITEIALETPMYERTTTILITGDADVIPGLEKVLKQERWTIEVYMWRQALSGTLKRFAADHKERVHIKELDNYMGKVTFTSMKFNISIPEDKFLLQKVKESGIVFTMKKEAFRKRIPTRSWCNQLESITQWPFQYYWFEIKGKKTDHLVIVFQHNEKEKPDVSEFLEIICDQESGDSNEKYCLPHVTDVQTFLSFNHKTFKKEFSPFDMALEQEGTYNKEDVNRSYHSVGPKHMKRYRLYSDFCRYKMNCLYGKRCQNQHTEEEKEYFRKQPGGRGNSLRKTRICKKYTDGGCPKLAPDCDYAHGEEDAWCLECTSNGHLAISCPSSEN